MADKWQAQFNFWSRFNLPVYERDSVPDREDISYPYITYEAASSGFDEDVPVSASVWTRGEYWVTADYYADQIYGVLANGGVTVGYDTGMIWITPGVPFAESMGDPDDDMIKRKLLSVTLRFS